MIDINYGSIAAQQAYDRFHSALEANPADPIAQSLRSTAISLLRIAKREGFDVKKIQEQLEGYSLN